MRSSFGVNGVSHKGRTILTTVGNPEYENSFYFKDTYATKVGYIPKGYEHRPDLISNLFLDTPSYWWLILQINNISDPFEGLNSGDKILIPQV